MAATRALALLVLLASLDAGCAAPPRDRAWLETTVAERTGLALGPAAGADRAELPPGLALADGLDADEAVAVALWRSPALGAELTALDTALADYDEARRPANPRLNFLAPIDPRQLALVLLVPIDAIWQVPLRREAAAIELERTAEAMVQIVLDLERDVRSAHAECALARERIAVRKDLAARWADAAALAGARAKAGDIPPAEADSVGAELALAEDAARRAERDADAADARLLALLGAPWPRIPPLPPPAPKDAGERTLPSVGALVAAALRGRAELRAAELAIHAAAARARWERSRAASLVATVDGQAPVGQLGPNFSVGLQGELPIFSQNQGGVGRAEAAVARAARRYAALRLSVAAEVTGARAAVERARGSVEAYERVLASLDTAAAAARRSFEDGAESYLVVVDALRRVTDARLRRAELTAELRRAEAELDRAVGGRALVEGR